MVEKLIMSFITCIFLIPWVSGFLFSLYTLKDMTEGTFNILEIAMAFMWLFLSIFFLICVTYPEE